MVGIIYHIKKFKIKTMNLVRCVLCYVTLSIEAEPSYHTSLSLMWDIMHCRLVVLGLLDPCRWDQ